MNKKSFLITVLIFILYPCISFSLDADAIGYVTKISINVDTSDAVNVSVMVTETPKEYLHDKASMWGGDEGNLSLPKKIIRSIDIIKNKQKIFIPFSAYADLGDPEHVALESLSARRFRLIITGSDAGGSYRATLEFKNNEIFSRKVVSGEFPQDAWEETRYKFNHLNN